MFKLSKLALIGALSVAFVSCGGVAHADPNEQGYVTVERLLKWYVSNDKIDNEAVTVYIGGVHDAFAGVMVCSPNNASLGDIKEAMMGGVIAAASADREVLGLNAGFFIGQVMARVWPCVKGRNV